MKRSYTIEGSNSGFTDRFEEPGWDFTDLFGDDYDEDADADADGNLLVWGRKEAIATARKLCISFSPCSLDAGEDYLIDYVVRRTDTGAFIFQATRTVYGRTP